MHLPLVRWVAEVLRQKYHGSRHGIALSGGDIHAWVPLAEVWPALKKAVKQAGE